MWYPLTVECLVKYGVGKFILILEKEELLKSETAWNEQLFSIMAYVPEKDYTALGLDKEYYKLERQNGKYFFKHAPLYILKILEEKVQSGETIMTCEHSKEYVLNLIRKSICYITICGQK